LILDDTNNNKEESMMVDDVMTKYGRVPNFYGYPRGETRRDS